ncbi:hypothetical protein ES288_D03G101500v1 [Gossypium darwinii]|uniref:Uncharacterized protein n=1 Tax=Gossypium darwinii TaxID=34276 RepID=A0A5D2D2U4_GOSDA|nr:hypothetical protein ES288_D03G101500v1 [Gossypium darwinii]
MCSTPKISSFFLFINFLAFLWFPVPQHDVMRLCMEAQECMVMGRWLDLASLMLTSAELVFPKVSDKGYNDRCDGLMQF